MAPCSCPSSVLCLLPSLLLLLQLSPRESPEKFQVIGSSEPIVAELGEDINLPCSLFPIMSAENMEVRWFWSHFSESVFIYQDRQELHEKLMAQYAGRTTLMGEFLRKGEATVTIHKVQASDNRLYTCFFSNGVFDGQASLEMQVAGVDSALQIHIMGPEEDGVCMVCMALAWFPQPQVQWRHPHGEQFHKFSEAYPKGTEGLFRVEATLVVRDSSVGSMTSSILNLVLGQKKAMAIVIPEPFFPWASPWMQAFLMILTLLLLLLLGATCYTWGEHSTQMRELQEQRNLCQVKEEALKDTARRKAQLYADWWKEQFQAWSVTLDPGVYSPKTVFSHNRKSVISNYYGSLLGWSVLGLEGITSGRCYWDVEVRSGDRCKWALGIWRKDEKMRYSSVSPLNGFWTVGKETTGFSAYSDPLSHFYLRQFPHRVGVFLDYDHGDVSFYDITDGSHIFSFPPESLSGALFPYFKCYLGDMSLSLCPLEAGPQKASVPMNNPPSLEETMGPPGEGIPSGSGVYGAPPGPEVTLLPCTPEIVSP